MDKLFESLNKSAFDNLNVSGKKVDLQGWMDDRLIGIVEMYLLKKKDPLIIEVGTWKGRSAIAMAKILQKHNINGKIITVDTWLGAPEFTTGIFGFEGRELNKINGYPSVFYTFTSNVKLLNLTKYFAPLPLSSIQAADVLAHFKANADVIYIDAAHEYLPVKMDIAAYWPLLNKNGLLVGDDYNPRNWPGVVRAVDEFVRENNLKLNTSGVVWYVYKE